MLFIDPGSRVSYKTEFLWVKGIMEIITSKFDLYCKCKSKLFQHIN